MPKKNLHLMARRLRSRIKKLKAAESERGPGSPLAAGISLLYYYRHGDRSRSLTEKMWNYLEVIK